MPWIRAAYVHPKKCVVNGDLSQAQSESDGIKKMKKGFFADAGTMLGVDRIEVVLDQ